MRQRDMFEFFLALFGGVYYAGKYISDSNSKRKSDYELGLAESKNRDFAAFAGYAYTESYFWQQYCKDDPWGWRDKVYNELSNELRDVFGQNYRQKFLLYGERNISWAYHLLLSRTGKVDRHSSGILGYTLGGINDYKTDIQICRCIEKNLNTALNKLGRGNIRLVQIPRIGDSSDWSLYGATLVFEHVLTPNFPRKRLW